ncbi:ceramide glucosyltransferase [Lichenicola sp.]|uniref:ceramide glucosyltransferase n=1 Tax=Lichenicola sp. TaxID=2804529 RepID=UPI003AFFDEE3
MTPLAVAAAAFCLVTTVVHVVSLGVAALRCRQPRARVAPAVHAPPVTIIRPVCRVDNFERETLASSFALDYPEYEIVFCVARADDPVAVIVRELIAQHPGHRATLLVGEDHRSCNPKLNNVLKGWDAARHRWIILADSNVLMPVDYVQRLMQRWRPDTGLVCSMPIGSRPGNVWASLECAFLNTFEARWQYVGETFGFGFAQGKSMLCRRDVVDRAGGLLRALGGEMAEDAAFTKLVRDAGLHVHLVDAPFEQPLGTRGFGEVWSRQRRWATLRRKTFPVMYLPEILTGSLFPLLAGAGAARLAGWPEVPLLALLAAIWFGGEAVLARVAGWHVSLRMLVACVIRDILLPVLWVEAWRRHDFTWRGNAMDIRQPPVAESRDLEPVDLVVSGTG